MIAAQRLSGSVSEAKRAFEKKNERDVDDNISPLRTVTTAGDVINDGRTQGDGILSDLEAHRRREQVSALEVRSRVNLQRSQFGKERERVLTFTQLRARCRRSTRVCRNSRRVGSAV